MAELKLKTSVCSFHNLTPSLLSLCIAGILCAGLNLGVGQQMLDSHLDHRSILKGQHIPKDFVHFYSVG